MENELCRIEECSRVKGDCMALEILFGFIEEVTKGDKTRVVDLLTTCGVPP